MRKYIPAIFFLFALLFSIRTAHAEERIVLFRSDIVVNTDGSMNVTENITVNVEGLNIKRGIYRDFPTRYKDRFGNNYVVDFEVLEVRRDGLGDTYRISDQVNGKRVYIGREDYYIPHGEHTYTITYRTTRQLGFFKDHDELYWNVTGNGWGFAIDRAEAQVALPGEAASRIIGEDAYTGYFGSRGKDFTVTTGMSGNVIFSTTRPLAVREGLTIVVSWPKGYVSEPDIKVKMGYFVSDNRAIMLVLLGILFILAYYLVVWYCYGRDPVKGTIIPLYTPADKLSPQAIRYIMKMGFDNKVFATCVINMAVKGYLKIIEEGGVYTLKRIAQSDDALDELERKVAERLFSPLWEVKLVNTNHYVVGPALDELKSGLKKAFDKNYFLTNIEYFIPGVIFSCFLALPAIFAQPGERKFIGIFMFFWLSIWSVGVTGLAMQISALWRGVLKGTANRIALSGGAIALTLFGLPFFIGEIFGIGIFAYAVTPAVLLALAIIAVINIIFRKLLKAPTLTGRRVMDKIEGFRMYLGAAEADRLQSINMSAQSPELFEKYLPYALALDVEQAWSERFSDVLKQASAQGTNYQPVWYAGVWSTAGLAGFSSGLGSSLSGAISSASVAPGSSSGGGGGGSSGGGGGGGGGGGW